MKIVSFPTFLVGFQTFSDIFDICWQPMLVKYEDSGAKKTRNFKPDFDHQVSHQNEAINFKKNRFKDQATFEGVDVRKIRGFRKLPLSL